MKTSFVILEILLILIQNYLQEIFPKTSTSAKMHCVPNLRLEITCAVAIGLNQDFQDS
jgi:hypothetical protein